MEIRVFENISDLKQEWEDFCRECNDVSVFHSYFWLRFLERFYTGLKRDYYTVFDDDKLVGICPVFFVDGGVESLPYSGFGGPRYITSNKEMEIRLAKRIMSDVFDLNRKDLNEIYMSGFDRDKADRLKDAGFIVFPEKAALILRLSCIDNFWKGLNANNRKNIKKALKIAGESGLVIREVENEEDLVKYTELEKENMSRLGVGSKGLDYWKAIFSTISEENRKILLVEKDNKVIAGRISLFYKNMIQNMRFVSLKEYQNYHPGEFLHFHIIQYGIENDFKFVNYGASKLERGGAYLFKKKFGGKEEIMWSAVYPLTTEKREEITLFEKKQFDKYERFTRS